MTSLCLFSLSSLRLDDHPALVRAAAQGPVVPVFVLDESRGRPLGGASRWWLKTALMDVSQALEALGSRLILRAGATETEIANLVSETGADSVFITRAYAPAERHAEEALHAKAASHGFSVKRYAGPLLFEPEQVKTKTGGPYTVFSPFWRNCISLDMPGQPLAAPQTVEAPMDWPNSLLIDQLNLDPQPIDWAEGLRATWDATEKAAHARLSAFLDRAVAHYKAERDRPDLEATSRLSAYLRFGQISPRRVWNETRKVLGDENKAGAEHFLRELGWREFSYHLLFHFPDIETQPLRENFANFPWNWDADETFNRWARGTTGYPIVDAGMRELWHTGTMHNRVRMIVASFLVKDMLYHWRLGEDWFWDTLVDADPANNVASWQWAAGCGADAAPYFRIFNPVSQGEKFDPDGAYVKRWVPELANMPSKFIHQPWEAPALVLKAADVSLGQNYPEPMLDRKTARSRALAAFETVKKKA